MAKKILLLALLFCPLFTASALANSAINQGSSGTVPFLDATQGVGDAAATGMAFKMNGTEVMRVTSAGSVGVGTTSPQATLEVDSNGSGNAIRGILSASNAGSAIYGQAGSTAQGAAGYFVVVGGGSCIFANSLTSWSCSSDIRLKKNVEKIGHSLDKILKIDGVYFQWKKQHGNKRETGVIAQNVIDVIPEIVSKSKDGFYSVEYTGLIPPLIEAVKELKTENDSLRAEIKSENDNLRARLEKLEAQGR